MAAGGGYQICSSVRRPHHHRRRPVDGAWRARAQTRGEAGSENPVGNKKQNAKIKQERATSWRPAPNDRGWPQPRAGGYGQRRRIRLMVHNRSQPHPSLACLACIALIRPGGTITTGSQPLLVRGDKGQGGIVGKNCPAATFHGNAQRAALSAARTRAANEGAPPPRAASIHLERTPPQPSAWRTRACRPPAQSAKAEAPAGLERPQWEGAAAALARPLQT